ncbi:hypothetical protein BC828DRAFT_409282 [Blastocladiella britannica]|nr:hypothetical protein BC828DRAFT_409282 [Blastocladiella britannica]
MVDPLALDLLVAAVRARVPRLDAHETASLVPVLVAVGLECVARAAPNGNLAACTVRSVHRAIADWLAECAQADQAAYEKLKGIRSARTDTTGGPKYFDDPFAVYPAWWGNEEHLTARLPALPSSASELLVKWGLSGSVLESAARRLDQAAANATKSRPVTDTPPWAAKRQVDEFAQTDPIPMVAGPSAVPGVPTRKTYLGGGSPMFGGGSGRAPPGDEGDEMPANGFFTIPLGATVPRSPVPPRFRGTRTSSAGAGPASSARAAVPSSKKKPAPRGSDSHTPVPPPPAARARPAASTTPVRKPSTSTARISDPRRTPTSVSFDVPPPPLTSAPVREMLAVARSALADDWRACFSSGSEPESDDDSSADKSDGGFPDSRSVREVEDPRERAVEREREARAREARMGGVGREWYKAKWAERDRGGERVGEEVDDGGSVDQSAAAASR